MEKKSSGNNIKSLGTGIRAVSTEFLGFYFWAPLHLSQDRSGIASTAVLLE